MNKTQKRLRDDEHPRDSVSASVVEMALRNTDNAAWRRLDVLRGKSDSEVVAAAEADPDAQPLTRAQIERLHRPKPRK